jgi:hypothetical protein
MLRSPIIEKSKRVWEASKKLISLGSLLEGQGEDEGGITELVGLGLVLSALGDELGMLSIELDDLGRKAARGASDSEHTE